MMFVIFLAILSINFALIENNIVKYDILNDVLQDNTESKSNPNRFKRSLITDSERNDEKCNNQRTILEKFSNDRLETKVFEIRYFISSA